MRRIEGEDLPYPWEIHYTQWQFKWLLKPENWNLIKQRQWPFCIQDDVLIRAGVSHHAAFEMVSMIKADMEMRLESTEKDGHMCIARYYNEYEDEQIARIFYVPVYKVNRRIRRAMIYMVGKQKKITYSEWIANGWNETPNPRKKPTGFLGKFSYGIEKKTDGSQGDKMPHKHHYILDNNSFGKCECGATKQFPVEKKLELRPSEIIAMENLGSIVNCDPGSPLNASIYGVELDKDY